VDRALDREDCRRELGLDLKNVNLPVVELPDGTRLFGPTLRDVADRLGFLTKPKRRQYDVSIYGAGPAGLSAAVYAASEGLSTVLIERSAVWGQAGTTSMIENYIGFPQGITGPDLLNNGKAPASWPLDRAPYYLETSVPGSFAAGDVRHRSIKRVATAAGEGAMAIAFVHRHLEETA
jgi:thioredoxin reductase